MSFSSEKFSQTFWWHRSDCSWKNETKNEQQARILPKLLLISLPKIGHKPLQEFKVVPHRDKRNPKKKSKGSTKLCHQGWQWVDQLLCLHPCFARHRPKGKYVVLRFEACSRTFSEQNVLFVMTRLEASSDRTYFFWLQDRQLLEDRIILPRNQGK